MAMLLGKKVGMTQVYDESGNLLPVTVIQAGPCVVMQVKTTRSDGYNAIQLGFDDIKPSRRKMPQIGHAEKVFMFSVPSAMKDDLDHKIISEELRQQFESHDMPLSNDATISVEEQGSRWLVTDKDGRYLIRMKENRLNIYKKTDIVPKKFVAEMRLPDETQTEYKVGDSITVSAFAENELVDVVGTSKGKGFAGVMKRHGFRGFPASHGTERKHRAPGSISSFASNAGKGGGPKRGKRMAGHMGNNRVTTKNHRVVAIDEQENLLVVKGPIPGPAGGYCIVRSAKCQK